MFISLRSFAFYEAQKFRGKVGFFLTVCLIIKSNKMLFRKYNNQ